MAVVVLGVIAGAFVALPVVGIIARAAWGRASSVLASSGTLTALRLSIVVATAATLLDLLLALPLALVLARTSFPGKAIVRAIVLLPLVLPPVVAGVGLLAALGRRGLLGGVLDAVGVQLPFTTPAAVIATAFVSFPLVVLATEAGLRSLDPRLEDAARTMGGSPWYVLRRVTLPLVRVQIAAGLVLAWARALGEFGATITFAGNFPGRTQTMPLAVYLALEQDLDAAIVLSLVLLAVSLAVLVSLRDRWLSAL